MKKFLFTIGIMTMLGAFLTGCSMGPEATKTEPITDEAAVQELYDIAKDAITTYFDVNIEDGVERKVEASKNYVLVDLPSATYLHRNNMIRGMVEGDPVPNQLYSYGVSVDPNTNAVTGAIVVEASDKEPLKYEESHLEEIARQFLTEKKIVEDPSKLVYTGIEKAMTNKQYKGLRFQYNNEDDVLVTVSLITGQVRHFEYSEKIEVEEAK
ncbi:hypothetical protein PBV87_08490 [Niameybacter massiliensis]|uniref:Lipoprotein n=1 Tax=Holtiella tumoricola TaxID=3018743 RepID=A0AA42DMA3_9FIRM|nr:MULTISPECIES: hypothetical protein [Lachnospirales]MDA3731513.1 hypothetical protein [Holtiella tumoricola]